MRLKCIYRDTLVGDKKWVDLVTHEEFDNGLVREHNDRINGHDDKINGHDEKIGSLLDKVTKHDSGMGEIDGKVGDLNARVDGLPSVLQDSLDRALKSVLYDKLEMWKKEVEQLREERRRVGEQLEELRKQREEMSAQLQKLKDQCDLTKAKLEEMENRVDKMEKDGKHLIDDYSMQVAEVKLSVPVPKKFAKFLFVQAKADAETEV